MELLAWKLDSQVSFILHVETNECQSTCVDIKVFSERLLIEEMLKILKQKGTRIILTYGSNHSEYLETTLTIWKNQRLHELASVWHSRYLGKWIAVYSSLFPATRHLESSFIPSPHFTGNEAEVVSWRGSVSRQIQKLFLRLELLDCFVLRKVRNLTILLIFNTI